MPVRIYDLAKKLGIESKEVISAAKEMGITTAKVASSSLDKITAEYLEEQLRAKLQLLRPQPTPPPAPEPPAPLAPEPRIEIVTQAPSPPKPAEPTAPPPLPPSPAPELPPVPAPTPAPAAEVVTLPPPVEAPPAAPVVPPVAAPVAEVPSSVAPVTPPTPPAPPPPPPEPPKPGIGDLVGRIELKPKPGPRVGDKSGSVKLPPRPGVPGKTDFMRRADQRAPQRPGFDTGRFQTKPAGKTAAAKAAEAAQDTRYVVPEGAEVITMKPPIIVRDLAEKLKKRPFELIALLINEHKVMATVNQPIDETVAQKICARLGFRFEVEKKERRGPAVTITPKATELDPEDRTEDMRPRAPVVTIMGHVDHGKTSLLDVVRKSNVAAGEAGGITQHIGAYTISVPHPERKGELQQITFLDTPGHAAFSAMRARGATVTDIVILVVAANDGVMPQTLEALSHAQAAKVPIIVAVNKCDHPSANPMKVRQQLQDKGLLPDDWGGNTFFVDVSALTKQGIDKLLEMICFQADLLELKANPNRRAKGNVIESGLEQGGPTATVLVRKGTLRLGDVVLCGPYWGKVRALISEEGKRLKEAGPSVAVKLLGLNGVPVAGVEFTVVENDKAARTIAAERAETARLAGINEQTSASAMTIEDVLAKTSQTEDKALKVVVKADTQGSVEAIVEALKKIDSTKISLEVVHQAVGTITENDVMLAAGSKAVVLGFHTRIDTGVSDVAKREGVQIKLYTIIYELIDEVKLAMAGLLAPIIKEVVTGAAEVRKIFELSKGGNVAGSMVTMGRITRGKVRVMRRKGLLYEGAILSLRRFQDEVNEVRAGMECGIRIDGFNEFQIGDSIECCTVERIAQKL